MRLAMAQMRMAPTIEENLEQTLRYMEEAKQAGADLIFFPEVQFSPFFARVPGADASRWLMERNHPALKAVRNRCLQLQMYASPNVYLELDGKRYDVSLMIDSHGEIMGISKMVHIAQAENFYEQDYYTPSDDGFKVYDTPFGKIGIVICFDRHLPDGIRSCALQGAELVIVPTANLVTEPMELFEWELRVQSFQSIVYTAMCNRVGREESVTFSGMSMVATPEGGTLCKAGEGQQLVLIDIPLEMVARLRKERNWLDLAANKGDVQDE